MASLINACLDNQLDVPYYKQLSENEVMLRLPKGKVLDASMELWLESFGGFILNKTDGEILKDSQKIILSYLYKSQKLNEQDRYTILLHEDNNHFEALNYLRNKELIYLHPNSPELYPVYYVHPQMSRSDFSSELIKIFGEHYTLLPSNFKEVLQVIYLFNHFGTNPYVSANGIGNYLYRKHHTYIFDENNFQNFKRNIRSIVNKLEKKNLIYRPDTKKPYYCINKNRIDTSLF